MSGNPGEAPTSLSAGAGVLPEGASQWQEPEQPACHPFGVTLHPGSPAEEAQPLPPSPAGEGASLLHRRHGRPGALLPKLTQRDEASMLVTKETLRGELQQFAEQTLRPCLQEIIPAITEAIEREVKQSREQMNRQKEEWVRIMQLHDDQETLRAGYRPKIAGSPPVRKQIKASLAGLAGSREVHAARTMQLAKDEDPPPDPGSLLKHDRGTPNSEVSNGAFKALYQSEYDRQEAAAGLRGTMHANSAQILLKSSVWQRRLLRIVERPRFEQAVLVSIVLSVVLIALEIDQQAREVNVDTPGPIWVALELLFLFMLTLELAMRLGAYRLDFFRRNLTDGRKNTHIMWNWIDLFIFVLQVVSFLRVQFTGGLFAIGRLFRLVRLVRILKIFRWVRDLRVIVYSIWRSLSLFFWSFVALMMMTFMFSCYFTEVVLHHRSQNPTSHNDESLEIFFGNMPSTIMSLFQAVSAGMDWRDLTDVLVDMPAMGVAPLVGYVSFALLAMMNVITGVFLETAIDKAKDEKEIYLARHASSIFKKADRDKTGRISWEGFESAVRENKSVQNFFEEIDIDHSEAESLFKLLDDSGDGQISAEEFLQGCMKVSGPAKSLDLLVLTKEVKQLFERHLSLECELSNTLLEFSQKELANTVRFDSLRALRECQTWSKDPGIAPEYAADSEELDYFRNSQPLAATVPIPGRLPLPDDEDD